MGRYPKVFTLPDEPERSVDAVRPNFFKLLTRDFIKISDSKEIVERAVDERRAFITMPLLQLNTVASDTPIGEYVDSPQNRSSCFVNFIEEPERLPFRYLFLGPSPAIVVVDDRVAHGFTPADPLMQ